MRVVVDTCVLLGHLCLEEHYSSDALHTIKHEQHKMLVCRKLLMEYRKKLCNGSLDMQRYVDRFLMSVLPIELMEKCEDPQVQIDFGPTEDRFHMQLAIDQGADYHISKDNGVLAEAEKMMEYGVEELHPRDFAWKYR